MACTKGKKLLVIAIFVAMMMAYGWKRNEQQKKRRKRTSNSTPFVHFENIFIIELIGMMLTLSIINSLLRFPPFALPIFRYWSGFEKWAITFTFEKKKKSERKNT